jgi:hypothetical protein
MLACKYSTRNCLCADLAHGTHHVKVCSQCGGIITETGPVLTSVCDSIPFQAVTKSLVGQATLFPTYTSLVLLYSSLLEGRSIEVRQVLMLLLYFPCSVQDSSCAALLEAVTGYGVRFHDIMGGP